MNKYFKAISYNFIFFFINIVSFLVLTPLAIRFMGEEFYGLWTILNAVMQFTNIGVLGLGTIVNKFVSEKEQSDLELSKIISSALIIILLMAGIISSMIFFSRNLLSSYIETSETYRDQISAALIFCAIAIIPQFTSKTFQGYFLSGLNNKFVRAMEFISSIFPWIGGIIIAIYDKNLVWISIFNLLIQISICLIYGNKVRKSFHWSWLPDLSTIKRMLNFSLFLFLESTAITLFQQLDRVIIGGILGPTMTGVYSVATSIGLRMSMLTGQITEVLIPFASNKFHEQKNDQLLAVYQKVNKILGLLVGCVASIGILWMKEILSIWINNAYAENYYKVFCIIILAYAFLSLCRSGHQTLTGMGKVKFTSITYLISSIAMLLGLAFFSQQLGLTGAAMANSLMITLLAMNIYAYQILGERNSFRTFLKDFSFGFILPIASFFVILFGSPIHIRIFFSCGILGISAKFLLADKEFQSQIHLFFATKILKKN